MADPASVVKIVLATLCAVHGAWDFVESIKGAPRTVTSLSRDLKALEKPLEYLGDLLSSSPQLDSGTRENLRRCLKGALDQCHQVAHDTEIIIRPFVKPTGEANGSVWKRLTFTFKERHISDLRKDMDASKQSLNVATGYVILILQTRVDRGVRRMQMHMGIATSSVAGSDYADLKDFSRREKDINQWLSESETVVGEDLMRTRPLSMSGESFTHRSEDHPPALAPMLANNTTTWAQLTDMLNKSEPPQLPLRPGKIPSSLSNNRLEKKMSLTDGKPSAQIPDRLSKNKSKSAEADRIKHGETNQINDTIPVIPSISLHLFRDDSVGKRRLRIPKNCVSREALANFSIRYEENGHSIELHNDIDQATMNDLYMWSAKNCGHPDSWWLKRNPPLSPYDEAQPTATGTPRRTHEAEEARHLLQTDSWGMITRIPKYLTSRHALTLHDIRFVEKNDCFELSDGLEPSSWPDLYRASQTPTNDYQNRTDQQKLTGTYKSDEKKTADKPICLSGNNILKTEVSRQVLQKHDLVFQEFSHHVILASRVDDLTLRQLRLESRKQGKPNSWWS